VTPGVLAVIAQSSAPAEGQAILIIGLLAILLSAVVVFKNPAGAIAWGFAVLAYLSSMLFGVAREWFYIALIFTTIIVVVGIAVRWSIT
jgi:hypothetical protein